MLFGRKEAVPYYDLHCHILPGMDDGAKNVEAAIALIDEEIRQGCQGLICTPHFYAEESIPHFVERRQRSFELLKTELECKNPEWAVKITLGAEVAYHTGLVYNDDLKMLSLGHSNYILLEMPFSSWTRTVLREVRELTRARGLRVIIAHLERYTEFVTQDAMDELLDMNVIIQMNTGCLLHRSTRKTGLTMVNNGIAQVLGTDCHSIDRRPPTMQGGIEVLRKNHLGNALEEILDLNASIYYRAMKEND